MQLHVGHSEINENRFVGLINAYDMGNYKPCGCFWTSTLIEENKSDWVEWCLNNNFYLDEIKYGYVLQENTNNILIIDSKEDIEKFEEEYATTWLALGVFKRKRVNWYEVSLKYDGVRLTGKGLRYSYGTVFSAWDVESTVWFKWCFNIVKTIEMKEVIK
jgi:hypothetical protein